MFDEPTTIISSSANSGNPDYEFEKQARRKKIIFIAIIVFVLALAVGLWYGYKNNWFQSSVVINNPVEIDLGTSTPNILPDLPLPGNATTTIASSTFENIAIEYLSFANFFKKPDNKIETKFSDYKLPLNVKIDVLNYYDISRKLDLDPALDNLNNNGFSLINNPWEKESPDFYSIYSSLESKQIPLFISSDFIIYYYQEILKKVYKDIEENIFYDNLWSINKDLYNSAKNRYEARLSAMGSVNDSILEGERLEAAFFAVALELLKPMPDQVAPKGTLDDKNKFVSIEAERFYFVTPPYLRDDVLREVDLIRKAKEKVKSPVMLYNRDYRDFIVPVDYRSNARLNNFYLTTKWLNSVFPLYFKDSNCPNCMLDKEDWRLSMIAASLISADFSDSPDLKNKWARIYKVMSYFNPLREDLNYVYYRDSLKAVFGENYKIEELFDDKNSEAKNNLTKLQAKLNSLEFPAFLGAIDKKDPIINYRVGLKMLVEPYSPSDYIISSLTYPTVDVYQAEKIQENNMTSCTIKQFNRRCNSIAFDLINLVQPIANNSYFSENTLYLNYEPAVSKLVNKFNQLDVWHTTNYWSTLATVGAYLNMDKSNLPVFSQSLAWRDKNLNTGVSAWVNMQLPIDKFAVNTLFSGTSFTNFSSSDENSYVEPNINLINELLAQIAMMQKMFSALQVSQEVVTVPNYLQAASDNLVALKGVITKELTGQEMTAADYEIISNFSKQLTIEDRNSSQKQLDLRFSGSKYGIREDISRLKLMVLIHQEGTDRVFSVGPVWDNKETR